MIRLQMLSKLLTPFMDIEPRFYGLISVSMETYRWL